LLKFVKTGVIKPSKSGTAHIPKFIRESLGITKIYFLHYDKVTLLYNSNATEEEITKILTDLRKDIKNHIGKELK